MTDTITIIRLEKSTAAAGATVGAPTGTNVGSVPAADIAAWAATDTTKIDGGKIYTGSVQAASIAANTITADKLAAKTITAASGVIADLAVDTLQIAGNAVTVPSTSYSGVSQTITGVNGQNTPTTAIHSITVEASGQPMLLFISYDITVLAWVSDQEAGTLTAVLKRGSTELRRNLAGFAGFVDTPPAGTHTYYLYIETTNVNKYIVKQKMFISLEVKR